MLSFQILVICIICLEILFLGKYLLSVVFVLIETPISPVLHYPVQQDSTQDSARQQLIGRAGGKGNCKTNTYSALWDNMRG